MNCERLELHASSRACREQESLVARATLRRIVIYDLSNMQYCEVERHTKTPAQARTSVSQQLQKFKKIYIPAKNKNQIKMFKKAFVFRIAYFVIFVLAIILLYFLIKNSWSVNTAFKDMLSLFS